MFFTTWFLLSNYKIINQQNCDSNTFTFKYFIHLKLYILDKNIISLNISLACLNNSYNVWMLKDKTCRLYSSRNTLTETLISSPLFYETVRNNSEKWESTRNQLILVNQYNGDKKTNEYFFLFYFINCNFLPTIHSITNMSFTEKLLCRLI